MKFDEYVQQDKEKTEAESKRKTEILAYEVAVIGCGTNVIGRIPALNKSIPFYEPDIYLYAKFGFALYYGYGDHGTARSSHRGYNVSANRDGSYNVTENVSYGMSHKLHVGVFACIDVGAINNYQRYSELFSDARTALGQFKELYIKARGTAMSPENAYCKELKAAFYEKIDELSAEVKKECGIKEKTNLDEARAGILRACRTQKSQTIYDAKRRHLAEITGDKSVVKDSAPIPKNLVIAIVIVVTLIALFALINK